MGHQAPSTGILEHYLLRSLLRLSWVFLVSAVLRTSKPHFFHCCCLRLASAKHQLRDESPRKSLRQKHFQTSDTFIIERLTGFCGIVALTLCVIAHEGSPISNTQFARHTDLKRLPDLSPPSRLLAVHCSGKPPPNSGRSGKTTNALWHPVKCLWTLLYCTNTLERIQSCLFILTASHGGS